MRPLPLVVVLGYLVAAACEPNPPSPADPDALAVTLTERMGGQAMFDRVPYLRFDFELWFDGNQFFGSRHLWDRADGDYRVEWTFGFDPRTVTVLFNLDSSAGTAWIDGQRVALDVEDPVFAGRLPLEAARYRFGNETYWLLMPWKLRDPGVNLAYVGDTTLGAGEYDLVHLTYQDVGMTPGDETWAFINRETGLMDRWAYYLETFPRPASLGRASVWRWEDWEEIAGLMLARRRVMEAAPVEGPLYGFERSEVRFPRLEVLDVVDDAVFRNPRVPLP